MRGGGPYVPVKGNLGMGGDFVAGALAGALAARERLAAADPAF